MLARAGFTAAETMSALGGVIAAAEADGIGLQEATNVTANALRAFALDAGEATRVADVLALTSARTNTNMVQLGEGMRYAAPIANQLGQSVEDTSMALGLLANMGLQGSVGGTALKNMMLRLASASDETRAQFEQLGVQFADADGNMRAMPDIIEELAVALPRLGGNMEQTAFLSDVFGLRGMAAAGNLSTAFNTMQGTVETATGESITRFEALRREIDNAGGAARAMADERLDTLRGAFVLLKSAIEGVSIEAFTGGLSGSKSTVFALAEGVARVAEGMANAEAILAGEYNPTFEESNRLSEDATQTWLQLGIGVRDAFNLIGGAIDRVRSMGSGLMESLGPNAAQRIGQFGTIAALAISGIAIAAGALSFVIIPVVSSLASMASGLVMVASALPLAPIIAFIAYIQTTREEGQTFGERLMQVFGRL